MAEISHSGTYFDIWREDLTGVGMSQSSTNLVQEEEDTKINHI